MLVHSDIPSLLFVHIDFYPLFDSRCLVIGYGCVMGYVDAMQFCPIFQSPVFNQVDPKM